MGYATSEARLVEEIAANIEAEISLFEELCELCIKERDCLVDLDSDGLKEATAQKEELVMHHRILEDARRAITDHLVRTFPVQSPSPTLSRIADAVGGSLGERLHTLRTRLSILVDSASYMADINRRLTVHTLHCVQGGLALLMGQERGETTLPLTYGATGRLPGRSQPSLYPQPPVTD